MKKTIQSGQLWKETFYNYLVKVVEVNGPFVVFNELGLNGEEVIREADINKFTQYFAPFIPN
jgi:hypothetical protein